MMENGVEAVDDPYLIQNKVENDVDVNESVDEKVVGGSNESRDSEGDEIFEEAIEQLQEQPLTPDSSMVDIVEGGSNEVEVDGTPVRAIEQSLEQPLKTDFNGIIDEKNVGTTLDSESLVADTNFEEAVEHLSEQPLTPDSSIVGIVEGGSNEVEVDGTPVREIEHSLEQPLKTDFNGIVDEKNVGIPLDSESLVADANFEEAVEHLPEQPLMSNLAVNADESHDGTVLSLEPESVVVDENFVETMEQLPEDPLKSDLIDIMDGQNDVSDLGSESVVVDGIELLPEESLKSNFVDVADGISDETILSSESVVVDGISGVGTEPETFKEATEVLDIVGPREEDTSVGVVEQKVFSNGVTPGQVDDERSHLNGLAVEHRDDDSRELKDVTDRIGTVSANGSEENGSLLELSAGHREDNKSKEELRGSQVSESQEAEDGSLSDMESELQNELSKLNGSSASFGSGDQDMPEEMIIVPSEKIPDSLSTSIENSVDQGSQPEEVQENSVKADKNYALPEKNPSTSSADHGSSQPKEIMENPVEACNNHVLPEEVLTAANGKISDIPSTSSEDQGSSQPEEIVETHAKARNNNVLPGKVKIEPNEKIPNISSTSGADQGTSQPNEIVENPVKARNIHVSPEVPETKPEVQPPAGRLSSARSSNSAPPAGLGRAARLLEPAPRVAQQQSRVNGTVSQAQSQLVEDNTNGETEEIDETREKLQMIRVKFLRLAHRLGQTPHNVVVAQVLYRLGLAEQLRGRNGGRVGGFSFDRASAMAVQLEAAGQEEPLDFSCTIMVLGKTGVGKSATINSIFDEVKFGTDAFQLGTKKVQDVVGTVQGIKVRVIDTPGLLPSWSDQRHNEKILHSVKRFMKKTPPDIVLYLDRLDMQSRDLGDMPLLRTITDIFGPAIWFNAIVVLTHAGSAPPDGPNGTATSYEMFVTQRSHVVQQAIRGAAGDQRLMNPVALVENHSACRTNRSGDRVLPNGQVWKQNLLLLSFASKILAEANTLLKLQDSPVGQPYGSRSRTPPLPYLLSTLLQSRPQLKLPEDQFGDDDNLDDDLSDSSESDNESEYDELPPFKPLTKAQLEKLTKSQKKAYFDEREYREKLFMRKQLREEKKRRRMMKKMAAAIKDFPNEYNNNNVEEEEIGGAASVPVPVPDLSLPASFDSDNPTHRYRYLDNSNQWLVRPVLETHGWDHDVGYEGINVERLFVAKEKIPVSFSGQVTKDKKDANLQMEVASSLKHGEGKATSLAIDLQTVGKDMAYTLRSESNFSNFKHNKATAGLSMTLLGDALSYGLKLEDKLIVNKWFKMVMSGGAMAGRGDIAYGGSLEATLRDKDYPLGRWLSTLGLSVMDWHGDLAVGCNIQSQIPVGRSTNLIARANMNNKGSGQVSIRLNSSEQLKIALIGLIPLMRKFLGYSEQMQFGQ